MQDPSNGCNVPFKVSFNPAGVLNPNSFILRNSVDPENVPWIPILSLFVWSIDSIIRRGNEGIQVTKGNFAFVDQSIMKGSVRNDFLIRSESVSFTTRFISICEKVVFKIHLQPGFVYCIGTEIHLAVFDL